MDTISVFDNLEMDTTQARVASRRALALAHNRVERNLGRFLRAARSEEEFLERLGLLQDDFAGYVTTASAEVGHDHPQAIASALRDHYRLAAIAKGVEFEKTPTEEQEEEEQEKTAYVRTWRQANPLAQPPTGPQSAPTALAPGAAPPAPPMDPAAQMQAPGAPGAPPAGMPGQGVPPQAPGAQAQAPGMQPPVDPMLLHRGHKQGSPFDREFDIRDLEAPGRDTDPAQHYQQQLDQLREDPLVRQQHYQRMLEEARMQQHSAQICPRCHAPLNDIGDCYECGYQEVPSPFDEFGRAREPAPEEEQGYGGGFPSGHMAGVGPAPQDPWGPHDVQQMCPQCGSERFDGMRCPDCGYAPHSVAPPGMQPHGAAQNPADQNDVPGDQFYNQHGQPDADPMRNQQGYIRPGVPKGVGDVDEGYEQIPYEVALDPRTQRDYQNDQGLQIAPNLPPLEVPPGAPIHRGRAQNPADQNDDSSRLVTCPECGGDGKTAGATKCAKCAGKGKVPNFGDPISQAYTSRRWASSESKCPKCGATMFDDNCSNGNCSNSSLDYRDNDRKTSAEDGNTDLGGPSPKMDKGQGPGSKPDVPGQIVEKDPVEPIKATNEGELKEIGDIEHVKLPTQTGDTPYATGGEDSGPHTDTFGNDGQAKPVTHETIESSHNPLSELLTSEFPPDAVVNEALLQLDK